MVHGQTLLDRWMDTGSKSRGGGGTGVEGGMDKENR